VCVCLFVKCKHSKFALKVQVKMKTAIANYKLRITSMFVNENENEIEKLLTIYYCFGASAAIVLFCYFFYIILRICFVFCFS